MPDKIYSASGAENNPTYKYVVYRGYERPIMSKYSYSYTTFYFLYFYD
jgi:hypothetical protein